MKTNSIISTFFVLFLVLLPLNFASVEVFSNYETNLKVTSDSFLEINKSLTLKNVYDVGIVPGQIEFKIARGTQGSVSGLDISEVSVFDMFGNEIPSQVRKTKDYSVIILDVYYPLLPGFEYEFNLFYKLSYESGGIFFKSFSIPLRESTIPIEKGAYNVELPSGYHFTYLSEEGLSENEFETGFSSWDIKNDDPKSIEFEYSWIPIKVSSFQGSYVFWITINILLLLFLVYEIRKEIMRIKEEDEPKEKTQNK